MERGLRDTWVGTDLAVTGLVLTPLRATNVGTQGDWAGARVIRT